MLDQLEKLTLMLMMAVFIQCSNGTDETASEENTIQELLDNKEETTDNSNFSGAAFEVSAKNSKLLIPENAFDIEPSVKLEELPSRSDQPQNSTFLFKLAVANSKTGLPITNNNLKKNLVVEVDWNGSCNVDDLTIELTGVTDQGFSPYTGDVTVDSTETACKLTLSISIPNTYIKISESITETSEQSDDSESSQQTDSNSNSETNAESNSINQIGDGIFSIDKSTVSGSKTSLQTGVGDSLVLTVQAKDNNNKNLTTGNSNFTILVNHGSLLNDFTDLGNGTYTQTLVPGSDLSKGSIQVILSESGLFSFSKLTIDLNPGPASSNSELTSEYSSIYAEGIGTSKISFTPKDNDGNLLGAGQTVTFSTNLGILIGDVVDNADGTYEQVFQSPATTGTATITPSVGGNSLPISVDIEIALIPVTFTLGNSPTLDENCTFNEIATTTYADGFTYGNSTNSMTGITPLAITSNDSSFDAIFDPFDLLTTTNFSIDWNLQTSGVQVDFEESSSFTITRSAPEFPTEPYIPSSLSPTSIFQTEQQPSKKGVCHAGIRASVLATEDATCVLESSGKVKCFGLHSTHGTLGNPTAANEQGPAIFVDETKIDGLTPATTAIQITGDNDSVCALMKNGTVLCWGQGSSNRLGRGVGDPSSDSNTPVLVDTVQVSGTSPSTTAIAIIHGNSRGCIIFEDLSLKCWGDGGSGANGLGGLGTTGIPTQVGDFDGTSPDKRIISHAIGSQHMCTVTQSGRVACWGEGSGKRTGIDAETDTNTPQFISTT